MSKIGNIKLSYGKQFNIAIANTYSNIVLSGNNLPANTIIISSNIDENFEDTGSYSMIATDNEGNPVRLTYCIKQGNGLYSDSENKDVLVLKIDNDTIKSSANSLTIDLSNFNHNNVYVSNNELTVDNDLIQKASENNRGTLKIDGNTILLDDYIFVNTSKLKYSNNDTDTYGILTSSDGILNITNGVISLNENKIPYASNNSFGLAKGDDVTVSIKENNIKVITNNLDSSTENSFGIINVDNKKIISNNGVLYINTNNLNKADENKKGIIGIDNKTIVLNKNGQITVNKYSDIMNDLESLVNIIDGEIKQINDIEDHILSQIK